MPVLTPWQLEEAIAVRSAEVIAIFIATDRARATGRTLTGMTVTLRIAAGSSVAAKVYTAVNRTQTGSDVGWCDVTLDETFHTEEGDFTARVFLDTGTGKPVLQWPHYTLTFVDDLLPTPTPTPTP